MPITKTPSNFEELFRRNQCCIFYLTAFLVRLSGILGEFGQAMARPNKPDMAPKPIKKVQLGINIHTKPWQHQVKDLISQEIRTADKASDWLAVNLDTVIAKSILQLAFIKQLYKKL